MHGVAGQTGMVRQALVQETGGLKIFSRLHVRNERYFKTGDEGDSDIGTRIPQLGSFGRQLGIFDVRDGCHVVTASGRRILETER